MPHIDPSLVCQHLFTLHLYILIANTVKSSKHKQYVICSYAVYLSVKYILIANTVKSSKHKQYVTCCSYAVYLSVKYILKQTNVSYFRSLVRVRSYITIQPVEICIERILFCVYLVRH